MNPSIYQGGMTAGATGGGGNSQFWNNWKQSILSGSTRGGSGGVGSTVGGYAGSAIGSAIGGPAGGMIGGQLGSMGGDIAEGAFLGGEDESGEDKYMEEKARSEHETRRWEERNAAPSAGLGNYMARALALQGYPVLGAINNLDFLFNKVMPYMKNYGFGKTDKYGNPRK